MSKRRLIIAGMGSIGLRHARLYSQLPDLQVEVCDSREAGLGEARALLPDVVTWTDYSAALDSQPDFVLVATPHQLHAPMACQALALGVRVLCEKPMSHRLDEAEQMVAASRANATPLAVGFHLRFHPSIVRLKAMLESGELGTVLFARYCVDSLITLENSRSRYQAELHGALLMDYSHGLDLLIHLLGAKPSRVEARGTAGSIAGYHANPLVLSGILEYPEARHAELHLSYAGKPEVHRLELITSHFNLRLELNSGRFIRHRVSDGTTEDLSLEYERDSLYQAQWQAFEQFCEGKVSPICSAEQALSVNQTLNELLHSLEKSSASLSPTAVLATPN